MSDLIDRQTAIDALEKSKARYFDRKVIIGKMQDIINGLPSAQRTAKWENPRAVPQLGSTQMAECSNCGNTTYVGNYCMECGRKMVNEEERRKEACAKLP